MYTQKYMAAIVIQESLGEYELQEVLTRGNISTEDRCTLEKIKKVIKKTGKNEVEYKYKTRLTAATPSLQYVSKPVRSFFCKDDYLDLDMDACGIRIIMSLVRDTEHVPLMYKILDYKKTCSDKKVINALLFGNSKIDTLTDSEHFQFKKMREEIVNNHSKIHKVKKDVYNFDGTALSHIVFYYEYIIINCAIEYFAMNNIEYSTIVFDGIHVKEITEEQIDSLEDYIHTHANITTKWKIKPWEDPITLRAESDCSTSSSNEFMRSKENIHDIIYNEFIDWAKKNKLIRLKDTQLVLKVVNDYHAETYYKSADETLNAFIDTKQNLFNGAGLKGKRENIIVFLKSNQPNDHFPVKQRNFEYFGYSDGLYCITSDEFITENFPDCLCRNYFDIPFKPLKNVPDDILKIFNDQNFTQETQDCILFMLGRAYFPINKFDTNGNVLNCYGASSTGKSTIIDALASTLDNDQVVAIGTDRASFALYGKNNKELLICNEAEHLMNGLSEDTFKSMCRGEKVEIEGKGKDRTTEIWTTPIILASQNPIKVNDKSGAINKKRLVNVEFSRLVCDDSHLKGRIVSIFPLFLPYLIKLYHKSSFKLSDQINDWNEESATQENYFYDWVHSMRSDVYQQVIYLPNSSVKPVDLHSAWTKHWKFTLGKNSEAPKISIHDNAVLCSFGIDKKKVQYCAFCEQKHTKGCCDNYDRTKRKPLISYINCAIVDGGLNKNSKKNLDYDSPEIPD